MPRARVPQLLALVIAVGSFSACTMWGTPKISTWKNSTGAEQFERLLWKNVQAGDWQELERHMASNYIFSGPAGTMDKQQMLAELRQLKLTDFVMGDVVVTPQGNDLIITYRIQLAGERAGIPLPDHRLSYMSVWQQRKDGWELVAQSRSDSR
jgi:hypothetical protein